MDGFQHNPLSNDPTKIEPRLFYKYASGWLDSYWPICRPQRTLTFWVNETFLKSFQQNLMSNDLTKIEPRLFYKFSTTWGSSWHWPKRCVVHNFADGCLCEINQVANSVAILKLVELFYCDFLPIWDVIYDLREEPHSHPALQLWLLSSYYRQPGWSQTPCSLLEPLKKKVEETMIESRAKNVMVKIRKHWNRKGKY